MNIDKIAQAIEADAGMPLADLKQSLAEMQQGMAGRTTSPDQLLIRLARKKTGKTQQAFSQLINTPLTTLRDWEQGRSKPPGAVNCLLELICRHPDMADELAVINKELA